MTVAGIVLNTRMLAKIIAQIASGVFVIAPFIYNLSSKEARVDASNQVHVAAHMCTCRGGWRG